MFFFYDPFRSKLLFSSWGSMLIVVAVRPADNLNNYIII